MNTYEGVIILKPELGEAEVAAFLKNFEEKVIAEQGKIEKTTKLGRRRLPYVFRRFKYAREGLFFNFLINGETSLPKKLLDALKINESVMRSVITAHDTTINKIPKRPLTPMQPREPQQSGRTLASPPPPPVVKPLVAAGETAA